MRPLRTRAAVAAALLLLTACTHAPAAITSSRAVTSGPVSSSARIGVPPTTDTSSTSTAAATRAAATAASKHAIKAAVISPTKRSGRHPRAPAPQTADYLTGGPINSNPVIAAKIDNTFFEVPQFGVSDADVVFVEQVEGGLTRIIAVFHSTLPTEVGPIRSVRSTDAQLLPVFGRPGLVFSGGAGGPLADLAASSIVDTSAMAADYFRSDVATGTYNLHADVAQIAQQAVGVGPVRSIGFHFQASSPDVAAGRPVSSLQVVMESGETDFSYLGGRFVRTRYGERLSDYQGRSEAADNVLVMNVVDTPDGTVDTNGQPSYLTRTVGAGALTLYRDGHAIPGLWRRASAGAPFTFLDAAHRPLPMKAGQTWIMLAPQTAVITVG